MLTPVDLQQKKFKQGMGYARKDVDSFFDIVVHSSYRYIGSLQNNRIQASKVSYAGRKKC